MVNRCLGRGGVSDTGGFLTFFESWRQVGSKILLGALLVV